jgi:hypothetical protein
VKPKTIITMAVVAVVVVVGYHATMTRQAAAK